MQALTGYHKKLLFHLSQTRPMHIRKYQATDKEKVVLLLRLNTPAYFAPSEEEDLLHYLDNFSDNYFVVEVQQEIAGCGGYNLSEDFATAKISWDIFHPKYQGKGLGTALTKFRIQKIRELAGVKIISVRTSQLVYKFYEKFGLQLQEVVKDFWAPGFDLYRLERKVREIPEPEPGLPGTLI